MPRARERDSRSLGRGVAGAARARAAREGSVVRNASSSPRAGRPSGASTPTPEVRGERPRVAGLAVRADERLARPRRRRTGSRSGSRGRRSARRAEVGVDVELDEAHSPGRAGGDLGSAGSIALHGRHQGAPNSTITGTSLAEHLVGERRIGDLVHAASLGAVTETAVVSDAAPLGGRGGRGSAAAGTWSIASTTIEPSIFDSPTRRSTNVIGISTTSNPARSARYVVSIWNP